MCNYVSGNLDQGLDIVILVSKDMNTFIILILR